MVSRFESMASCPSMVKGFDGFGTLYDCIAALTKELLTFRLVLKVQGFEPSQVVTTFNVFLLSFNHL